MGLQHNSGGSSHCVGLIFLQQLLQLPVTETAHVIETTITEMANYYIVSI